MLISYNLKKEIERRFEQIFNTHSVGDLNNFIKSRLGLFCYCSYHHYGFILSAQMLIHHFDFDFLNLKPEFSGPHVYS